MGQSKSATESARQLSCFFGEGACVATDDHPDLRARILAAAALVGVGRRKHVHRLLFPYDTAPRAFDAVRVVEELIAWSWGVGVERKG